MTKVVLVSSAQPSANPRLIKEVKTLFHAGYIVSVVWCPLSKWADKFDTLLFESLPNINWVKAGYHSNDQPFGYWYARVRQKIWQLFYTLFGNQYDAAIKSLVLFSQELASLASVHQADIFIGHNLGALPAIAKASKKYNAKSIFDFEDYHRGEFDSKSLFSQMIADVENCYIPQITSITSASPAIAETYRFIFQSKSIITINNTFPLAYSIQNIRLIPQQPLKLFWFSQFVGKQRGLESVIKAMSYFAKDEIILTLLGSVSINVKNYFTELLESYNLRKDQLVFLDPVSQDQIVSIASMHHIGLALEYTHNQNRDLCLTNKLFMYLLAGNALVVSNTLAQKTFLSDNPGIGSLCMQENAFDLSLVLKKYFDNPDLLNEHRKNALQLGINRYNWNIEKNVFLKNIEQVLTGSI